MRHAFKLVAISWAAAIPVALSWTALALLLSARTRSSIIGIGLPAILGVLLQVVWIIDGPPLIGAAVPQAALNNWHGLFQTPAAGGPLLAGVLVAVGWAVLWGLGLALVIRRRDAVAA